MSNTTHEINRLRHERSKLIAIAADDILATISLLDSPDRLAVYDLLMAQPRRDIQARLRAIEAELSRFNPTIRYR